MSRIPALVVLLLAATLGPVPPAVAAPSCGGRLATLVYGNANNHVHGTTGNDVVVLGGGNDTYRPNGGTDVVCGGAGEDIVYGVDHRVRAYLGADDDWAQVWQNGWADGGPGRDTIVAAYGATARGGAGDDELSSQAAEPRLAGGPGDDRLIVGASNPRNVDGGTGLDTLITWFGDEGATIDLRASTIVNATYGTVPFEGIENAVGTPESDVIKGDASANRLDGSAGDDVILGRGGDDTLVGGTETDRGNGGPGRDVCDTETKLSC